MPPKTGAFSMMTTRAPRSAAKIAAGMPAVPPPTTIRSKACWANDRRVSDGRSDRTVPATVYATVGHSNERSMSLAAMSFCVLYLVIRKNTWLTLKADRLVGAWALL